MAITSRKIINDPVHGFITINDPVIAAIVNHPYYQRLRRIQQMALAQLVYPGAVHTRLHHSLGAYHLMCNAITELKDKGINITDEETSAYTIDPSFPSMYEFSGRRISLGVRADF